MRQLVRRCRRAVALAAALLLCMVQLVVARMRGPMTPLRRALWLQGACRLVLASLGIKYNAEGAAPSRGLLVSNHLSYLDILIYSAAAPCVFVSKAEVSKWPYFGFAARQAGTIFIDRTKRVSAQNVAQEIARRLDEPVPILVFPEGTSSDGARVMHFHSALFEPAVRNSAPVTVASVRYVIEGGVPERELCWYGDEGFLPHLWKALGTPGFTARVQFGEARVYEDRKTAARLTREEVAAMRGDVVETVS